ncbi:MAG: acetyl-CoA carboxylase biotin carboxylase subunit [Bacteroidetes bacterium]|nr:acetyl-CoA carboxylase biotin carboxylase subunit [Bacteroidota bacterium]
MSSILFRKVLIANRGEIALRIMRTLRRMGIASVAVFHELDREAPFVRRADESYLLGDGTLAETYLNLEKILDLAQTCGADAIHPGYGFLSENPAFPEACAARGITFIGPDAQAVRLMGNKIEARRLAIENGLPVTKGYTGTAEELLSKAELLPYPVLVKAAAGGGGKGMRIVVNQSQLEDVLVATSREAAAYFGDGTVYVEQYVSEPRHVEIQILADHHGHVVHLFERECSIQRRYQKIIEESPSPGLNAQTRKAMGEAAVALCRAIGYRNAGTIEFLLDNNQQFYFLEMNTRIQVEHPVTELVTGIDLVEEQLHIAGGKPLRFTQNDLRQQGHAIECRIYAEDPEQNFMPSPGRIVAYEAPAGDGIRVDSAIEGPANISSMFDPMISKLIVWAPDRKLAIAKTTHSLKNFFIAGISTNIPFLLTMLGEDDFQQNSISTAYTDRNLARLAEKMADARQQSDIVPALAAGLCIFLFSPADGNTLWHRIGYWRLLPEIRLTHNGLTHKAYLLKRNSQSLDIELDGNRMRIGQIALDADAVSFEIQDRHYRCPYFRQEQNSVLIQCEGWQHELVFADMLPPSVDHGAELETSGGQGYVSPMPGKVISINVKEGETVNRGTVMIVIEAMKMENNIVSTGPATVKKIFVKVGDMVDTKTQLVDIEETT